MKNLVLFSLVLSLLAGCGLPDLSNPPCREDVYQEYSIKGDFLLDHGERIVFAPKCYYDPASPDFKCGIAALGVETRKTVHRSQDNMDCPGVAQGAVFNYDSTDFDKLVITTPDGSSKPLLSYSFTKNAYDGSYGYDNFATFSRLERVDSQQVQMDLIECDSLGVVDFSIKDAKGNKVRMKYDLSYFLNDIKPALIVTDSALQIHYGLDYSYLGENSRLNTKCTYNSAFIVGYQETEDTNVVTNSYMEECLNQCVDCHGEIPIAKMQFTRKSMGWPATIPDLVLACESEPEIQDTVPSLLVVYGKKEVYCKAVRIIPYLDYYVYKPPTSDCPYGEGNPICNRGEESFLGNIVYKPSQK